MKSEKIKNKTAKKMLEMGFAVSWGNQNNILKILKSNTLDLGEEAAKELVSLPLTQKELAYIAKNGANLGVCLEAVKKLTDLEILAEIAQSANNNEIQRAALQIINDNEANQKLLYELAKDPKELFYEREAAIRKLTDKNLLANIINGGNEYLYKYSKFVGSEDCAPIYEERTGDLREVAKTRLKYGLR